MGQRLCLGQLILANNENYFEGSEGPPLGSGRRPDCLFIGDNSFNEDGNTAGCPDSGLAEAFAVLAELRAATCEVQPIGRRRMWFHDYSPSISALPEAAYLGSFASLPLPEP